MQDCIELLQDIQKELAEIHKALNDVSNHTLVKIHQELSGILELKLEEQKARNHHDI